MLVLSVSAMAKTIYRLPKVLKIKGIIKRGAGEKLPWLFQFSNPQILKVRLSGSWAFAEGERLFPFSKQLAIRAKKSGKKEKQESCKQQVSLIAVEFACPFFFFSFPCSCTHPWCIGFYLLQFSSCAFMVQKPACIFFHRLTLLIPFLTILVIIFLCKYFLIQ